MYEANRFLTCSPLSYEGLLKRLLRFFPHAFHVDLLLRPTVTNEEQLRFDHIGQLSNITAHQTRAVVASYPLSDSYHSVMFAQLETTRTIEVIY